ncbi:MAG: hypothetical protein O2992_03000 [Gemmatimonadetes bacterium]|jgi:hypothetical protein|nr:hypothetical protein [Gemmatimonadota bacterium]
MSEPDLHSVDETSDAPDHTLGGYLSVHDRPPGYDASDGHPYTVSLEVEQTANLRAPYAGYLVFPRWAQTGVGVVGHVETPTLVEGRSPEEVTEGLGALTLVRVQQLLEEAIEAQRALRSDPPT